ncbi:MAG: SRPBCC family protein [Thermoleophilia bacterium]|nr:SRPBCC family protein [Thermoleophilia bacterium]
MSTIEETIEVGVPVRAAYDQWTQFEEFPRFMEGVEEVRQLDDTHLHWRASVAGDTQEWDAEITEQVPERVIAWRATGGYRNAGAVRFEPIGGDRTRIHLHLDHEPEGTAEKIGDRLGMAGHRVGNDLKRFREMIESRGAPTGGWGGEVHGGTAGTGMAGEQITDPLPPLDGPHGDPEAIGMSDDIRRGTGMSGDATGATRTDIGIGIEREVHDVSEGPTPETREAMRGAEGEGRDITEGPTPATREAMDDERRRRGGDGI